MNQNDDGKGTEMNRFERISEMEAILEESCDAITDLQNSLNRMEEMKERMGLLFQYYGSEDWYADRELELPPDMKAGVLSEDLVYDTITEARDASFQMLELATDMLKNRI